jgi:hypothetical protein
MADIFQYPMGPPITHGLIMLQRDFRLPDIYGSLWFTVIGMHASNNPLSPQRSDFTNFNTSQVTYIDPDVDVAGTIYFLLRITYRVFDTSGFGLSVVMSEGLVNYRCSFDYAFGQDKGQGLGAEDLILYSPVQVKDPYEDGDVGVVVLSGFNPDVGLPGGPKFIRINPSVSLPNVSSTSQGIQVGGGQKVSIVGTVGGGTTVAMPQSAVAVGTFKLSLHVIPTGPTVPPGPPQEFIDDMAVRLFYSRETETDFTRSKQKAALDWVTKINRKYPQLAEAVRSGGPLLHVDGFASITGNAVDNQQYALRRLRPVKECIATQLAVPATKISPKPYGSQLAAWEWDFDARGGAVKGPQASDRMVKAWFDAEAAWKVVQGPK